EMDMRLARRSRDRYHRDITDFPGQAASYRRRMPSGEPLDDNAAVWYQQSFAHFPTDSVRQLGDVIRGGFDQYPKTSTAALESVCAEARHPRVVTALRCTDATGPFHPIQRHRSSIRFRLGFSASASR